MGDYYKPEEVAAYWDGRHREWDDTWPQERRLAHFKGKHDWFNLRFAHLLPIPDKPEGRVLDFGCGCGMYSAPLLERFGAYWGIDASESALGIARKEFGIDSRNTFLGIDDWHSRTGFDMTFDCVISITVLQHLHPAQRIDSVQEIKQVLKPDGLYVGLEWIGATQAYDMPAMPVEQWREAWLPWVVVEDDPPVPAWRSDNVWVARRPA